MRTTWMFQVFIASIEAWSTGPPSHIPLPWTQANSPLERLTPSRRYVAPVEVTRWLPETCRAGADEGGGGLDDVVDGVVEGVVDGVVDGVVEGVVEGVVDGVVEGVLVVSTIPLHTTPLTVNTVGAALVPL